jgi:hypothetical protein
MQDPNPPMESVPSRQKPRFVEGLPIGRERVTIIYMWLIGGILSFVIAICWVIAGLWGAVPVSFAPPALIASSVWFAVGVLEIRELSPLALLGVLSASLGGTSTTAAVVPSVVIVITLWKKLRNRPIERIEETDLEVDDPMP